MQKNPYIKIEILIFTVATLIVLVACGNKKIDVPPLTPTNLSIAAPAPMLSPSEMEREALEGCTARSVSLESPSINALVSLQDQMRCIENFLDTNRNTEHWQKAYSDRAKAMMDSMVVIKALNVTASDSHDSDMTNTQQILMDRDRLKKLKSENYFFVKRAIEEITISLHHALFQELREGGMRMGDPQEKLNESNRKAKQTGIWEASVDEVREGGQFVVARRVFENKSPMFLIEGYGTVSIFLKIEDNHFDDNGAFSDKCKVYLSVTQTKLSYDCSEYLNGNQGRQIIDSIKLIIKEDMARKASRVLILRALFT